MRRGLRLIYSRMILWAAAIQLLTGGLSFWAWKATGNQVWLTGYFRYQGAIYFILLDAFGLWLCIVAWREFKQREPLGGAWLAISIAMFIRLAGDLLKHWLCLDTYINPLHYVWRVWNTSQGNHLELWGSALGGPLFMGVLAIGMYKGLQHYRRARMLGKLKPFDRVLIVGVGIYALYVLGSVISVAVGNPSAIQVSWILTWPNDLLLALLLFEAILLTRTTLDMGPGYVGRTWGAFAVAIFLTSVESFALWMTTHGSFPYPQNSIMWFIWFIWAAAFAMGPAYQVDAIRFAKARATDALDSNDLSPLTRVSYRPSLR